MRWSELVLQGTTFVLQKFFTPQELLLQAIQKGSGVDKVSCVSGVRSKTLEEPIWLLGCTHFQDYTPRRVFHPHDQAWMSLAKTQRQG